MQVVASTTVLSDEVSDIGDLLELITTGRPWWFRAGACRTAPLEVTFFPALGEDARPAKQVCDGCPVTAACRAWALEQGSRLHGVWGGTSVQDRAVIRRQQRIASMTA